MLGIGQYCLIITLFNRISPKDLIRKFKNGVARINDNTLAGSLLTLNKAIINMMNYAEVAIWEAVSMASINPARLLGLDKEIGSIEIDKRANIVAVDHNGNVKKVWIDGIAQKI